MSWVVYAFKDADGRAFYVGSGRVGRAEQHFRGRKASAALARRFAEIGPSSSVEIITRHESVQAARAAERDLIASFLPSGGLVNSHAKPGVGAVKDVQRSDILAVRLDADARAGLERAAAADCRPISTMCRKIIAEWLVEHAWLRRSHQ